MTKSAVTYAWTIIVTGLAVLACAVSGWKTTDNRAFLVCLGLSVLASTFKVRLPKLTGTISPAFVFVLVSVATRSWPETVMIAVISGVVQVLWRPMTRPTRLQIAFNGATMAICGGVAHGMARGLSARGEGGALDLIVGVAGVTLLVSNTLIISAILFFINEVPFRMVWRSLQAWTVPYYVAGGVMAGVWARPELTARTAVTVLAALSVYVMSICYREFGAAICHFSKQDGCGLI